MIISISLLMLGSGCSPAARPLRSFDQICHDVEGKTTVEVEKLLGEPNYHAANDLGDEKWIWWNFAVLDGARYPPEVRGQVVHIEITFHNPFQASGRDLPRSQWRVRAPFGVSYMIPRAKT
jgi:hypothetical protein